MKSDCLNFVEEPKILYPQKKSVSKYVSLLSDYGFKYVFGKIANKEIMQEFKEYQETMKTERDINSIKWTAEIRGMERGMKEGMEKGMEKGIEKGKQEQTIIFAMNLKADGFPSETIAKYTGLSVNQIEML